MCASFRLFSNIELVWGFQFDIETMCPCLPHPVPHHLQKQKKSRSHWQGEVLCALSLKYHNTWCPNILARF